MRDGKHLSGKGFAKGKQRSEDEAKVLGGLEAGDSNHWRKVQ